MKLFSSDPHLEGFIYLAHSYQAKIATATTVATAQKLSDMHNNHSEQPIMSMKNNCFCNVRQRSMLVVIKVAFAVASDNSMDVITEA
ncbi:MAG: hypothetical protein ACL7BU_16175 [Candidatus Phlomobacter fragariae]